MSRARSRTKTSAARNAPAPTGFRLSWRGWLGTLWLVATAATALGLHNMDQFVQRTLPIERNTHVEFADLPPWLSDPAMRAAILDQVLSQLSAGIAPDTNIHDERVCPYVVGQLGSSGWVSRVRRVAKVADGRIVVYADFRKPFAFVQYKGLCYLIDAEGVRLPPKGIAESSVNRADWLVIEGVEVAPPTPGARWPGPDVEAALALAGTLYDAHAAGNLPFRRELRAIDVSRFDPRIGGLRLITGNPQSYIIWGLPPGQEYDVESSAAQKIAGLMTLFDSNNGRLPTEYPIDVRPRGWIGRWVGDRDASPGTAAEPQGSGRRTP